MPQYSVGQAIKCCRERKNISQPILCDGICSVGTLSRIENGQQNPSANVMEALLERLGLPIGLYNVPVTEVRFQRAVLEQKITHILAGLGKDISALLNEYANLPEPMDKFEQQFHLQMTGIQNYLKHSAPEEILPYYIQALKITFPEYDLEKLPKEKYFTSFELIILNNIALEEHRLGKKDEAEKILLFLKEYYESGKIDDASMEKEYPIVLANLSNWMEATGRFEEEYEISKTGLEFCIRRGKLSVLEVMAFNIGYSLIQLGRKDEGIKYIDQAFSLMELKGQKERLQKGLEYVQKIIPYERPTHKF
ncbi:MAG: helix-turn-helix transcriptional regulator [Treponema sp.]|nr:helix-turn-helix transcriptional regulator [Treponema sp.]